MYRISKQGTKEPPKAFQKVEMTNNMLFNQQKIQSTLFRELLRKFNINKQLISLIAILMVIRQEKTTHLTSI